TCLGLWARGSWVSSVRSSASAGIIIPDGVEDEGQADACRNPDGTGRPKQAHHRDTPPVDVHGVAAGLLARGSSFLSVFPRPGGLSDFGGQNSPLTVAGAAPASHRLPS